MKYEQKKHNCLRTLAGAVLAGALMFTALAPGASAAGVSQGFLGKLFHGEDDGLPAGKKLVPVGHTVGIKLFSDGVLVVGLAQVDTPDGAAAPARACGLREGDIITHINAREVDTIEDVQSILAQTCGGAMSIRAVRGDSQFQVTTQAAQSAADGSYKLGAWIRDSMAGIGTVTYYDPDTGTFAALGHAVSDADTGRLMPLSSGGILHSSVAGVQKGEVGQPGQLRGAFDVDTDLGSLYANTPSGVFGTLREDARLSDEGAVPVASRREVHVGEVTVRSNIEGEEVREYKAEITRIYPETPGDTRNFLLKITDPELLTKTGGIVQGMVVRYNRDNTGKP